MTPPNEPDDDGSMQRARDRLQRRSELQSTWFANDRVDEPLDNYDRYYLAAAALTLMIAAASFSAMWLAPTQPWGTARLAIGFGISWTVIAILVLHLWGLALQIGANRFFRPTSIFVCVALTGMLMPLVCCGFGNLLYFFP